MPIRSINPATEEVVKTFPEMTEGEVDHALQKAQEAFKKWQEVSIYERAALVKKVAEVLREHKNEYSRLQTLEMGKPIAQGPSGLEKCAWACEVAGEMGPEWLKQEMVTTEAQKSYVRFDPLGVILAVMPWNFPFWQFFRFGAGALVAGNAIILKHASNVPQCALAIQDIFAKAGAPEGLVQTLLVGSDTVDSLIADPRIAAVTLTGSTSAGEKVASTAGRYLKKCVLELGGSDPFIVLSDADIEKAAQVAVQARTINSGQSCIAAKRFIVVKDVAEEFTNRFVQAMSALVVGDPMDEKTQIGPLARKDLVDELDRQVQSSVAKGAKVLCGGKRRPGLRMSGGQASVGYFYEPTVLSDVKPGMPAYDEELFGPVASVIVAQDEDDAVRIANDSIYGLGAAIWTRDTAKAEKLARQLECGAVFINDFVKSDPRLPFGGVKQSGYGRELGVFGMREFTNIKTVVVK